jgi:hypothetical protein
VIIKLFQEWSWTSFMPTGFHDWRMFIKPEELLSLLAGNGLRNLDLTGLSPGIHPLRVVSVLRARKRGRISYLEAARRIGLRESRDRSVLFLGYAVKAA